MFAQTQLRARRLALGLTQAALADLLDVSANTVARWERGELRVRVPRRIALACNDSSDPLEARLATHVTSDARGPDSHGVDAGYGEVDANPQCCRATLRLSSAESQKFLTCADSSPLRAL